MKTLFFTVSIFSLIALSLAVETRAQLVGGYSSAPANDAEVLAAAKSAIALRDPKLKLLSVEKAERQVVAGLNYRLRLNVNDAGAARAAEVVVWRKLDGNYELTMWKWLESKSAAAPAPQAGLIKAEFIYETAPFPSCHATTLAEGAGGLVAAWFGGTAEKNPDVGIWVSRQDGGNWTAPVEVANGVQADGKRHPCWNPVLFQPKSGPVLLFYKVGPSPSTWWGMLRTSDDGGKTWSDARRLPDGILGPIKNKPVQLANGDLLCPTSTESSKGPSRWRVRFERTTDLGKTWTSVAPPATDAADEINAIQPSILFHNNGALQALGRTRAGKIFETWSSDSGATWSALKLTSLPNPNAGTDAVTLRDGRHLLVYNPVPRGRTPLHVAVSDDGKIWQTALVLEDEAASEFSYPAVIQTADGLVHISYTWKRKKVRHVVINPAKLELRAIEAGK
jgi:predicted neuraminidase